MSLAVIIQQCKRIAHKHTIMFDKCQKLETEIRIETKYSFDIAIGSLYNKMSKWKLPFQDYHNNPVHQ